MRVICTEPSHRLVVVDTFNRLEDGTWEATINRNGDSGSIRWSRSGHPRGARRRHRLECRKCGLNAVATDQQLGAVLNPLADAGETQITLRGLAGILANLSRHLG